MVSEGDDATDRLRWWGIRVPEKRLFEGTDIDSFPQRRAGYLSHADVLGGRDISTNSSSSACIESYW